MAPPLAKAHSSKAYSSMRKYVDFVLIVAIFGIVAVGALAASGRIGSAFGSLGSTLAWLIR